MRSGAAVVLRVGVRALARLSALTVGFIIRDALGNDLFGTNTYHLEHRRFEVEQSEGFVCEFENRKLLLGVGDYGVSIALHSDMTHYSGNHDWWDRALAFEVVPGSSVHSIGVLALDVGCRMHAKPAEAEER